MIYINIIKTIILTVLLSISIVLPGNAQQKSRMASPVYLGSVLLEQPDSSSMANICVQYHMNAAEPEEDYAVFEAQDGTKIRFMFVKQGGRNLPVVEIVTKEKADAIKQMLAQSGFTKTTEGYIKGSKYANKYSLCTYKPGKVSRLTFTKVVTSN